MKKSCVLFMWLAVVSLLVGPVPGLVSGAVNVQFQPRNVYNGYINALVCEVASVDSKQLTIELKVQDVLKGKFEPKTVTIKAVRQELLEAVLAVEQGQQIVAFANQQAGRGGGRDIIYYVGGGKWYKARVSEQGEGHWDLLADADEGKAGSSIDIMFAVFNGSVPKFVELIRDMAADRDYYPARPFTRFTAELVDTLPAALRGVAIHDLNGDDRLDIVATSDAGLRVYLQDDAGQLNDRTETLGLTGIKAVSVSGADVDGDGDADLLLDGVLYLQANGKFAKGDRLPSEENVLSAAFVEVNNDGRLDVIISRKNGGLTALIQQDDGSFVNRSEVLGFDALADGSGYFEAGDWNGNGRTDLIYLSGPGWLVLQNDEGKFDASPLSEEGEEYAFATAAMAPIVEPQRTSTLILHGEGKWLLETQGKQLTDVTRFGNEIQDDLMGGLMVLAEDLNADGTIDLYIASRDAGAASFFCLNRGYGSFMLSEKYAAGQVFPPQVYNTAAWGLAAGDMDGDGTNDLLVGALDGKLWLLRNQALADRPRKVDPQTFLEEQRRIAARILTVKPRGSKGVLGATIELRNAADEVVMARWIGGNIGVGCAGPSQAIQTVREPGAYTLRVRFADGKEISQPVDLSNEAPRHQTVTVNRE